MEHKYEKMSFIFGVMKAHKGRKNPITSEKVQEMLELNFGECFAPTGNGNASIRMFLAEVASFYNFPLGSCSKGYFIIQNRTELNEYVGHLYTRVTGIYSRIDETLQSFNKYYKDYKDVY